MTVPVGVIGVGAMGRHHVRVFQELPGAELVGVHDVDGERAEEVASEYGIQALSLDELLDAVEAVSLVVPTPFHHEMGQQIAESGTHLLVEKPLTETLTEGESLIETAEENDVLLQVGHIERFNPAVRSVAEFVDDLDIIAVEARRLGPPIDPDRTVDDGVILDLMIHDIDVVCSLVDEPVTSVSGDGTAGTEYVTSTLEFENGIVGSLTASRVTQKKVRELTITAEDCQVTVDYTDQTVMINRRTRPEYLTNNGGVRYRSEHVVEQPTVDNGEPLKKELGSFLDSVRSGNDPVVSGADGLRALKLAYRISDAVE